jgi:hypothetical protein
MAYSSLPHQLGHTNGKDPISTKKLEAGDARWAPSKELLGFICDGHITVTDTVQCAGNCTGHNVSLLKKNRTTLQKFQSLIRRMCHVADHFTRCTRTVHPTEQGPL